MHHRRTAAVLVFAVVGLTGCDSSPRVIVRNDTQQVQHVFYCWPGACTRGVPGNDVVLKPGEQVDWFWNSPDGAGPVGVATSPGNLLLGCLDDPSAGQDAPPTRTLVTSKAKPCNSQRPGQMPHVQMVNPD